jgi:hypothetical protein
MMMMMMMMMMMLMMMTMQQQRGLWGKADTAAPVCTPALPSNQLTSRSRVPEVTQFPG